MHDEIKFQRPLFQVDSWNINDKNIDIRWPETATRLGARRNGAAEKKDREFPFVLHPLE